ncbi:MAG: hypothetical protein ACREQX_09810 [Candidatus Binataceae bacterium]
MTSSRSDSWLGVLRRYLLLVAAASFLWEICQLPGFADWRNGSWGWLAFIAIIGTVGDVLIAATALALALVCFGDDRWPERRSSYWRVAAMAWVLGLVYTAHSEWRNAVVLHTWTYSSLMPVLPVLGIGLFPLLQWILIPAAIFYYMRLKIPRVKRAHPANSKALNRARRSPDADPAESRSRPSADD